MVHSQRLVLGYASWQLHRSVGSTNVMVIATAIWHSQTRSTSPPASTFYGDAGWAARI